MIREYRRYNPRKADSVFDLPYVDFKDVVKSSRYRVIELTEVRIRALCDAPSKGVVLEAIYNLNTEKFEVLNYSIHHNVITPKPWMVEYLTEFIKQKWVSYENN